MQVLNTTKCHTTHNLTYTPGSRAAHTSDVRPRIHHTSDIDACIFAFR